MEEQVKCFKCGKLLTGIIQYRYDDEDEKMLPVCDEHKAGSYVYTGE